MKAKVANNWHQKKSLNCHKKIADTFFLIWKAYKQPNYIKNENGKQR